MGVLVRPIFWVPAPLTDPTTISGCTLWLDAADSATITHSGGAVSQWDDKSANGYALAQPGASTLKPTTGASTINSLNVLDFDGGDDLSLTSAPINNATDGTVTVLAVVQSAAVSGAGDLQAVSADDTSTVRLGGFVTTEGATGRARTYSWATGETDFAADSGAPLTNNVTYLNTTIWRTSNVEVRVDGASSGATSTTANRAYSATSTLIIGDGFAGGGDNWNGKIAEVVAYDRVLSGADLAAVEQYLRTKWGTP